MIGVQEINQERKRAIHNLSRKEVIKKILTEMIEILDSKPSISFRKPLCATSQIQHYDHLRRDCQPKYEELYSLKSFDIRQKNY